jgi:hypothetical protein
MLLVERVLGTVAFALATAALAGGISLAWVLVEW